MTPSAAAKVSIDENSALEKQQRMFDFPDDGYAEVFLRPDVALRRARLMLRRMERAEQAQGVRGQEPESRNAADQAVLVPGS